MDIEGVFARHADAVYRVCFAYLRSKPDAEDVTQQVFLKLIAQPRGFEGPDHERAWLIACASNACKDVLKSPRRTRAGDMPPDVVDANAKRDETLDAVMALEERLRVAVYLHYYEGYTSEEIGAMVGASASTVRNWLAEARGQLRVMIGT